MIKFDLHIHSYASKYKEGKNIVDGSTIEDAEVLMDKLNEQHVGLFSITDHNRFWLELHTRFDALISSGEYPNVKGLVAGVEFDVQMDSEMDKCHIITIFDAKNNVDDYRRIHNVIESHLLEDKNSAYSRTEYENLLHEIGLDMLSGLDLIMSLLLPLIERSIILGQERTLMMISLMRSLELERSACCM